MNSKVTTLCVLVFFVLSSCQSTKRSFDTIKGNQVSKSELDSFIQNQIDSLQVAGLSIAIIRDNKIAYNETFGFKNLTTKEKATNETIFEACSLSKPIFAYFVMLQVEKGVIDLDKRLYKYLPSKDIENDPFHKLITARMVLNHNSGLPNWRGNNEALKILFKPGTSFGYSGEGYQYLKDVLAHLLKVNDEGLNEIFLAEVTLPLKLESMNFTWREGMKTAKAFGHRNQIPTDNDAKLFVRGDTFGAGYSLHTTAKDYARFLIHLMNKKSNNSEMVKKLLLPQQNMVAEKDELPRSIGFPIKNVDGNMRYSHSGNNGDFRAYCKFYKDKGFGLVMLSNSDNFNASGCAQNIVEFLQDL